jgi:hypothetical protein
MENIILIYGLAIGGIIFISICNAICFLIGARTSQKAQKGEEIKLPTVNPMEIAKERREQKKAEIEQNRFDIMLENINNYSGDSTGQKDIPR